MTISKGFYFVHSNKSPVSMLLLEIIVFTLKVEDPGLVGKRVMFAYEQCLLCLGHHPDIWLEAALYLQDTAKILQVVHYITIITTLLFLERILASLKQVILSKHLSALVLS